ncbi:hypothetical protein LZG75_12100 [Polynucleobacter sp. IMCC30063]|uniref:hypothetical protein n=1 Tax=Polynucleobacter sp. IMCC30063 TaxID=2907298 RepID=UPI001F2DE284|nr:hypothetical protein [Polynucleobacter sp. IMCC30063]MCE7506971.1 hypothetical protein [Polynucleobacter sp. IMCC30063]
MENKDLLVTLTMTKSAKDSFINFKRTMEHNTGLALSTTQTMNALTHKNLDWASNCLVENCLGPSKDYDQLATKYIVMFRDLLKVPESDRTEKLLNDASKLVFNFDMALHEHLSYREILVLKIYYGLIPEFDQNSKDLLFTVLGINNYEKTLANIYKRAKGVAFTSSLAGLIEFTSAPRKPLLSIKNKIAA